MGFAQQLLRRQFPYLNCLQPTVLQEPHGPEPLPNQLQVIDSRGDHWIPASNIGCANGVVTVYNSVYRSVDKVTSAIITNLFQSSATKIVESPKQKGETDCGAFRHSYSYCSCSWNHESIQFRPNGNETAPSKLFQGTFDDFICVLLIIIHVRMDIIQL